MYWDSKINKSYKSSNYKDDIIFLGEKNNFELVNIYSSALAFCFLSYFEGFGIPIIEAMKSGCPVIVKNGSSIDEVVNNSGLMLKTADPAEIAEAIKGFDDLSLRNKFIKIGIENSYRFTTSKLIKNYNMLYSL